MIQRPGLDGGYKAYLFYALFLVAIVAAHPLSTPAASAEPANATILHTNNVTGHLFACPT